MKPFYCLAASFLLAASALAQTLVTTPVMGFLTLNLQEGTNFMGFALLPSMELQGVVNIAEGDRTRLLLQGSPQITLTNDQFSAGALPSHAVEIVSEGAGLGFTSVVVDTLAAGNEITLENAVPEGVANGATIKVWKLWTLAEVFGAANTAGLTGGETPAEADLIQVPNGTGFDEYFYSTGGLLGTGWRKVGVEGAVDQSAVPFEFSGGLAIRARSAKSIIIVGQVKPGKTMVTLQPGNNFVANLCPVNAGGATPSAEGRKLSNSGLEALKSGIASNQADLVLLWNGKGYDQYYYSTSTGPVGQGWRRIGAGGTDQSNVALPDGAFIIYRRDASTQIQLNQGDF